MNGLAQALVRLRRHIQAGQKSSVCLRVGSDEGLIQQYFPGRRTRGLQHEIRAILARTLAARSIKLRSSGLMRMFSVSRLPGVMLNLVDMTQSPVTGHTLVFCTADLITPPGRAQGNRAMSPSHRH